MNELLLGIVSLFSLGDYQNADTIYYYPDHSHVMNDYNYGHYEIWINNRQKTCLLNENKRGLCYDFCFEDEIKVNNQCTPIDKY